MLDEPRATRWPRQLRVAELYTPGRYQALLALPVADETLAQIEKDLPRTLSQQHSSLLTPGSALWVSLRNLLIAFAAFDAATGYVQSMNFVAAFLLQQGLQEEAAFWSLVALVTRVVPYFGEGMPLAKLDGRVFGSLLHELLPAVGLHLAELGEAQGEARLVPAIVHAQWLLKLFVTVLSLSATLRVWDAMCEADSRAPLFCAALALCACAQPRLLRCAELGEAVELLQSLGGREEWPQEEEEAFGVRFDAFRGRLSPAALAQAAAFELGDAGPEEAARAGFTGPPSRCAGGPAAAPDAASAALPPFTTSLEPASDVSELLRGTVTPGLFALATRAAADDAGAHPRTTSGFRVSSSAPDEGESEEGLQAELAAVALLDVSPAASPGRQGPAAAWGTGGSCALSAECALRVSAALQALERGVRASAPWLAGAAREAVRARVLRPLGALQGGRLGRQRQEWEAGHGGFAAALDGVLRAEGLDALDTERPTYLGWWDHGDGVAALHLHAHLLRALDHLRAAWRATAGQLVAAATPPGRPPAQPPLPGDAGCAAVRAALAACTAAAAQQLRATTRARFDAAAADEPRLAANVAAGERRLRARARAAADGWDAWAHAWAARRAAAAAEAHAALRAASACAADALAHPAPLDGGAAGSGWWPPPAWPEGACGPACLPAPTSDGSLGDASDELRRLCTASEAVADAAAGLRRRGERVERDARLAAAVRARAAARAAAASARCASLQRAAAAARTQLASLSGPAAPPALEAVLGLLGCAEGAAADGIVAGLADCAVFLDTARSALAMGGVTLVDRCLEDLALLVDTVGAALRHEHERESSRPHLGRDLVGAAEGALGTISKALQDAADAAEEAGHAHGEGGDGGGGGGGVGARGGVAATATRRGAALLAGALRRGLREAAAVAARNVGGDEAGGPGGGWVGVPSDDTADAHKSRAERALELELRELAARRAALQQRKEEMVALLRGHGDR